MENSDAYANYPAVLGGGAAHFEPHNKNPT
jgi:hypothetical protein